MNTIPIKKKPRQGLSEENFRRFEQHLLKASLHNQLTFDPSLDGLKPTTWITYARDARRAWMQGKFSSEIIPANSAVAMVTFHELTDGRVMTQNSFFEAKAVQILAPAQTHTVEIKNGKVLNVFQKQPVEETVILKPGDSLPFEGLSDGSLNPFRTLFLVNTGGDKDYIYSLKEAGKAFPNVEIEELNEGWFRLR